MAHFCVSPCWSISHSESTPLVSLSQRRVHTLFGRLKRIFEDNDDGITAEEHLGDVTITVHRLLLA